MHKAPIRPIVPYRKWLNKNADEHLNLFCHIQMTTLEITQFRGVDPILWNKWVDTCKTMRRLVESSRTPIRKLGNIRRLYIKSQGLFLKYVSVTRENAGKLSLQAAEQLKAIMEAERNLSRLIGSIIRVSVVTTDEQMKNDQIVLGRMLSLFVEFLDKMS